MRHDVKESPDEIARRLEAEVRSAEDAELGSDSLLQGLRTRTPQQVGEWVDANVNSLTDAKALLKALAKAVTVLARRA